MPTKNKIVLVIEDFKHRGAAMLQTLIRHFDDVYVTCSLSESQQVLSRVHVTHFLCESNLGLLGEHIDDAELISFLRQEYRSLEKVVLLGKSKLPPDKEATGIVRVLEIGATETEIVSALLDEEFE